MSAAAKTERLSKEFWAITEQWTIERVTGYDSMTEGYQLFNKFQEAKEKALLDLSAKINGLKLAYNRLQDAKKDSPNETNPQDS